MASIIRIKRSGVSGNPTTLAAGELAYSGLTDNGSNGGDRLYVGMGTETAGNAANHVVIGGKFFTDRLAHTAGVLTASSALVVDSNKKLDELLVDNLSLNGSTVGSTGELILSSASGVTLQTSEFIAGGSYGGNRLYLPTGGGATLQSGYEGGVTLRASTNNTDWVTVTLGTSGALTIPGTINTLSNGDLTLAPNGTGKLVLNNPYVGDTSTSLAEYIYDTVGGAITAGTGITITNDDSGNSSTVSITNTTVTAGSYGSATAIPTFTVNAQGQLTAAGTVSISTSLSVAADSGTTDTVALGTDTLTFSGGTGLDSVVSNNNITFNIDSTVATLTGTQTLTNKTLTAPVISTISNSGTLTLPTSTDTLVGRATSDTLTNKTINASNNTLSNIANASLTNSSVTFGSTTVALGATSTSIAGVTELTVDNININGSTISSTDTNGNIIISPNGTGKVDVSGSIITGLTDPVDPTDAATKQYVDTVAQGLHVHEAARVATTDTLAVLSSGTVTYANGTLGVGATLTLSAGITALDGVTLANGDRILVKNQVNTAHNGLYVRTSATVLTRAADFDTAAEIAGGDFTFVEAGTLYGKTGWVQTFEVAIVGTDTILWDQFSGQGLYIAGAGLTLTGNTFDAVGTADRITVNPNSIDIASTYVGQTSITTLGTIGTGTWNGTTIGTGYGGTGLTSYATGDLLYASATNTLSKLTAGADGKVLQINSSGVPVWADIDGGTY